MLIRPERCSLQTSASIMYEPSCEAHYFSKRFFRILIGIVAAQSDPNHSQGMEENKRTSHSTAHAPCAHSWLLFDAFFDRFSGWQEVTQRVSIPFTLRPHPQWFSPPTPPAR